MDGMASLVGDGARLGIAHDARLGNHERGPRSSPPCIMNDDAGYPPERDRTTGFSTGPRNQRDVDSYIGRDRTTRFSAGSGDQSDGDFFIGATGSRDPSQWLRNRVGLMRAMQDRAPDRATGTRPGRSPHRSPGGVFSPRSGRRSPIRVLPGGPAAGCTNQHSAKPPPLDLPAGS